MRCPVAERYGYAGPVSMRCSDAASCSTILAQTCGVSGAYDRRYQARWLEVDRYQETMLCIARIALQ
jgi:hypothetical protein